ncbi:LPXTG-motif cell wall-anchored protein/TQXA domain-containing protein [Stackebrandtia albiflava]|uniref:LPXTG-motif cell wall-anchored protein/TQXA domain-containing protein n=1 Tax=Stackebrandtia albiflava TaxID=406432 RepID=A0A562V1G1_9ACTN|nr:thioester domain-containing protein [Stackebrandtia albiflava]TWJ11718.1 LPXTG-motif cell wall-anchored protein/TQXA domain-containing protein [Stackebrandtia albiflava]
MKNNWLRATVALTAAGALGIGMAGTAAAEDEDEAPTPVRGIVTTEPGWGVTGGPGATRISITPDGASEAILAYCIDIETSLHPEFIYEEGAWDASNVNNLAKVQWVLHHSFPTVDPAALAEAAGADLATIDAESADEAAYTATQAAIWSLTDGFALDTGNSTDQGDAEDAVVTAIYNYLTAGATEMPEPITEITFDGPSSGDLSEKIGPFTATGPGEVNLTVENGKLVDADDNELTSVPSGGEFYILPDEGATEITVTGTATVAVPTGTVFMSTGELAKVSTMSAGDESQKLILAGVIEGETEAQLKITVTGDNTLPVTGLSLTNSLLLGAALLVAGAVVLVVIRRRRTAATWGDAA